MIIENEKCGCSCPDKIKKVSENTKKIKEKEKKSKKKNKKTALNKEVQNEIIKETDTTL